MREEISAPQMRLTGAGYYVPGAAGMPGRSFPKNNVGKLAAQRYVHAIHKKLNPHIYEDTSNGE